MSASFRFALVPLALRSIALSRREAAPSASQDRNRIDRRVLKAAPAWLSVLGLVACLFGMSNACAFRLYTVGGDADCSFPDIQSAINNAIDADGNSVLVARSGTYSNQHLVINGQNINLLGGLDNCSSSQYSGQTTIRGTSGHSVIEIEGTSTVYLGNLDITGGNANASQSGGGIYFGGQGSLALANSTVSLNTAGYGGGIDFNGGSGPATLTLDSDTLILRNTALNDGGGIRVEGNARLFALLPHTLIGFNHAPNGYGGGITVVGPARADIGSPGYNGSAVLQFNDAQNGGAIAVFAGSNQGNDGTVRLFTTDPANPVQVANNTASAKGGAIYLKSHVSGAGMPSVSLGIACAFDFRIDYNIAPDGAAVFEDWDHDLIDGSFGSELLLNDIDLCGPESPPALGAVACAPGVACNEISGNVTEDLNNNPTEGAVIAVGDASYFYANRLDMRNNTAGHLVENVSGTIPSKFLISTCLMADNHTPYELVGMTKGMADYGSIDSCTVANNTIGHGYVLFMGTTNGAGFLLQFSNSIIDQPGDQTVVSQGGNIEASYLMLPDAATFPVQSPNIISAQPTFVDAVNGNYHLQATSWGVDFAPAKGGTDLDRKPRDVDLPQVPNVFGPRDLGAYERQFVCAADTIFCNGFELYQ